MNLHAISVLFQSLAKLACIPLRRREMLMTSLSLKRTNAFFAGLLCMCVLSLPLSGVHAQEVTLDLQAGLSEEEFQAMLGRLSDEQVRDILISEFAARHADDAVASDGIMTSARQIGEAISTNARGLISQWSEFDDAFGAAGERLRAAGGIGYALFAFGLSLGAAFASRFYWRRRVAQRQMALAERNAVTGSYASIAAIFDSAVILALNLSGALVFSLTAMAILYLFFANPDIRLFASGYISVVAVVLIVHSFLDLVFPLNRPLNRLVAISDEAARLVHRVVMGLAALWMFEAVTSDVLVRFGAPAGTPELFSLALSLVWITSVLLSVYLVSRATADLLPAPNARGVASALARNWAAIMVAVQILVWVLFTGGGLAFGNVDVIAGRVFYSFVIFIGLWISLRILVHYLRAQDFNLSIKGAIHNAATALLFSAGLLFILGVWGLDQQSLSSGGTASQTLKAIVNVALTAIVGWAIWDFIRTLIDVRTEAEKGKGDDAGEAEGEGGLGASRTATLLPLLRSTALVLIGVTCLFAALSSLGVNVGPLVAGAGVIGLAVGFGAQTLVKDVVSGVFFLIDDAFRRDEYIDLGSVKGTVERISVRSLQLRHHLGAVHTIPFGDIAALTNYSRDWVIVKLPLRLTFDTDPQKVKKIIKKIGAEFMEDELVNDGLLEPPKSQGVVQMEDSAMILRVKFKAVPGKQFVIRRELLHRIRSAFEEAGIRFANREVTVRVNEDATHQEKKDAIGGAAARAIEPEPTAT